MSTLVSRLWNHWIIRYGVWFMVSVVTLYLFCCAYVNWAGPREWAKIKAELENNGETTEFAKLLPPNIDPALNFCAVEPLDGIARAVDQSSPGGKKRTALDKLGWKSKASRSPATGNRALGIKKDFAVWAKFARDTGFVTMPPDSGNSARDLFQAIDSSQPLLKQLADAAATHPLAMFTPSIRDKPPRPPLVSMPVPHYSSVQTAQGALGLRAVVANECGDSAAAINSVLAMLRLADGLTQEPTLIAFLVALTTHASADDAIWSILEKRTASDAELRKLQTALEDFDFEQRLLLAIRGELAVSCEACDYMRFNPSTPLFTEVSPFTSSVLGVVLPTGVLELNKARIARMEWEGVIRPLKVGGYGTTTGALSATQIELNSHRGILHPSYILAQLTMPAFSGIAEKSFVYQTTRHQAILGCALERFYLQHHSYPAALSELVPAFIAKVPADPMDQQPMRYRQTDDGRYMLWSVGFDLKDDNGKMFPDSGATLETTKFTKPGYKGDWSWQYQPVK